MRKHGMATWAAVLGAFALVAAPAATAQYVNCAAGLYSGATDYELFPRSPRVDCTLGDAVRIATARQVRDKDAGIRNAGKDAAGLDGTAAKEAIVRYQKSFRSPEPAPNAFQIGVTGSQSGGTQ